MRASVPMPIDQSIIFFSISGSHVQNIVFYSPQTSEIHQQQDANMSADANAN